RRVPVADGRGRRLPGGLRPDRGATLGRDRTDRLGHRARPRAGRRPRGPPWLGRLPRGRDPRVAGAPQRRSGGPRRCRPGGLRRRPVGTGRGPPIGLSDEPERPRRESLGDRIERSIDSRTDAVTEIARGEAESAARGPSIRRTAFWLLVTGVSLYLVAPSLLDVLGSWQN